MMPIMIYISEPVYSSKIYPKIKYETNERIVLIIEDALNKLRDILDNISYQIGEEMSEDILMEDNKIISLFMNRSEKAIKCLAEKYEKISDILWDNFFNRKGDK